MNLADLYHDVPECGRCHDYVPMRDGKPPHCKNCTPRYHHWVLFEKPGPFEEALKSGKFKVTKQAPREPDEARPFWVWFLITGTTVLGLGLGFAVTVWLF